MVLSDFVSIYNKEVILNANCTLFPEFKNIRGKIKSAVRSKSNSSLYILEIETSRRGKRKRIKVDTGMNELTISY